MNTVRTPPVPPVTQTAYQDSGSAGHNVQVTRNVPPKRVMVTPGSTVEYGGKVYKGGDSFLLGDGPVADQFANIGAVVVVEHDAAEAWNGAEGDEIRKHALATIDAAHKAEGTKRSHHHGFAKYDHADGPGATPVDVTQHRQIVAQQHLMEGRHAHDDDFGKKAK